MSLSIDQMRRDLAIVHTCQLERGWWPGNQASDPNPTLDGVTQRAYNRYRSLKGLAERSVRAMEAGERDTIYRWYWDDSHAEALPFGVDALHFAYCFNAGASAGIEVLQSVVGAVQDGQWGPKTAAAVQAASRQPVAQLFYRLAFAQLAEYRRMIANPRLAPNARSWMQRLIVAHETFGNGLFANPPAAPAA